jgi:hypothetical protein
MTTGRRNNNRKTMIMVIVVVLLVLLACGCIAAIGISWYWMSSDTDTQALYDSIALTQQARSTNTTPIPPGMTPQSGVSSNETGGSDACLTGVFPGKTTRDEVINLWGTPLGEEQEWTFNTLFYQSPLKGQYNTVYLENQVVSYISIVLSGDSPKSWLEVKAKFGEPAHTAYTTYIQGSRYYGYPTLGIAFIADQRLDYVYIQDCFVPMTLEEYITSRANSLPTEDPFNK